MFDKDSGIISLIFISKDEFCSQFILNGSISNYKISEVVESYNHPRPENTWHLEEE